MMTMDTETDANTALGERAAGRTHGRYRIQIGNDWLEYRPVEIQDPVPTGRQILEAAEARPVEEYLVFQVLGSGLLEELRLDEITDLRERGVEHFLIFRSDRSFRFELDDRRYEWGAASVLGLVLKTLAGVEPATHGVWLERKSEPDVLVYDTDSVELTGQGIERFRTAPTFFVCIEDTNYPWPRDSITTEEIAGLGGWDPSEGVIVVDEDQSERNLEPGEIVELRPGLTFGKKFCFRRGAP